MTRKYADITRERNRTRKELVRNKAPRQDLKEAIDDLRDQYYEIQQEIQEYKKSSVNKKANWSNSTVTVFGGQTVSRGVLDYALVKVENIGTR